MKCKQCGEELPTGATSRRAFCDDVCRVKFNRALKSDGTLFNATVAIRRLAKDGKKEDLKYLRHLIDDILGN